MQKIRVRGADGSTALLALVRETKAAVYACPLGQYARALSGDEDCVVGFPKADVTRVS